MDKNYQPVAFAADNQTTIATDDITSTSINTSIYQTDMAVVSISTLDNTPPSAVDDTAITNEDENINIDVMANDYDADGDPLYLDSFTRPSHGNTVRDKHSTPGDLTDDTIIYIPKGGYSGPDSFTYTISDGQGGSSTATVTINVLPINNQPVANNDAYETNENETLIVTAGDGVLENDEDVDGDTLTATLASNVSHGTLTLNSDGSFTYTPAPHFSGIDSFTYTAHDAETTSVAATVTITVTDVPSPPAANNDAYSLNQGEVLNVPAPGVLGNDSDPDSAALTASLIAAPAQGILVLNPNGSFVYDPGSSFSGTTTFTYQACDNTGLCASAVVTLSVIPLPPTVTPSPTLTPTPTITPTQTPTPQPTTRPTQTATSSPAEFPGETENPSGSEPLPARAEVTSGNLHVIHTAAVNRAHPGDTVTLEIDISNIGTAALNNVVANHILQGSGFITRVEHSQGTVSIMPQSVNLTASSLPPGQALTAQISILVGSEEGLLTSCLTVTTTEGQVTDICIGITVEPESVTLGSTSSGSESAVPDEDPSAADEDNILPLLFEMGLGHLQDRSACLQTWGFTLTCMPFVRYILLLGGIVIVGWGLWMYWPFRPDEKNMGNSAGDAIQQHTTHKPENQE